MKRPKLLGGLLCLAGVLVAVSPPSAVAVDPEPALVVNGTAVGWTPGGSCAALGDSWAPGFSAGVVATVGTETFTAPLASNRAPSGGFGWFCNSGGAEWTWDGTGTGTVEFVDLWLDGSVVDAEERSAQLRIFGNGEATFTRDGTLIEAAFTVDLEIVRLSDSVVIARSEDVPVEMKLSCALPATNLPVIGARCEGLQITSPL